MTADEIKALAGILHEDARWVGKQYSSPIGDRIEKAVDALEFLSNQLLAKTELANLYAASLRKVEAEVEGLTQENQRLLLEFRADCEKHAEELFAVQADAERYRRIRLCRSDYYGDVYAMVFAADGDYPEDGENLDRIVDAAIAASVKEG